MATNQSIRMKKKRVNGKEWDTKGERKKRSRLPAGSFGGFIHETEKGGGLR